jgi:hypothetical protein
VRGGRCFTRGIKTSGGQEVEEMISSRKWFVTDEEVGYKIMIHCTDAAGLRNMAEYLYKLDVN